MLEGALDGLLPVAERGGSSEVEGREHEGTVRQGYSRRTGRAHLVL